MIRFHILRNWLVKELNVKKQLQIICLWYVLSLMVVSRKHYLEFASEVSGKNKSQFRLKTTSSPLSPSPSMAGSIAGSKKK